jgi:alginate O-acetyltransferase complex protein AlgI
VPRALRVAVTFLIVCVSWVFFRAANLTETWRYLQSMAGFAAVRPGQEIISISLFTPYHLLMFGVCAAVVWAAPQTWHFTQTFSPSRAVVCFALFLASITVMWTQTVNPFLYFQF